MRTGKLLAPIVASAFGLMLGPAPALAANPVTYYDITYGRSYERGTITWYNQSVGISHTLYAASDCRMARFYTTDANSKVFDSAVVNACSGAAKGYFSLQADAAGGAYYTWVFFYEDNSSDSSTYVKYVRCRRGGERPCTYGPAAFSADDPAAAVLRNAGALAATGAGGRS